MFIPMLMILSILTGSILKLISLIFMLVMFKNLNVGYNIEEVGSKRLPSQYRKYMNDYKILFTVDISFILFLLLIFMIHYDTLNEINFYNLMTNVLNVTTLQNIINAIPSIFLFIISLGIIGTTAGEVYMGNLFSKIHKKRIQI
jgi:hypothetical protein